MRNQERRREQRRIAPQSNRSASIPLKYLASKETKDGRDIILF